MVIEFLGTVLKAQVAVALGTQGMVAAGVGGQRGILSNGTKLSPWLLFLAGKPHIWSIVG